MTRPPTTNDMTEMEPSPEERSEGDFRFLHSSQLATRHHAKVCLDLLATLAREYPGETRFAIIKENIVDMESTGTDSQEYALARFVRPQLSAETLPMTNGEREAVEQMIDKITNALESSDCQMHVFKSSKELADAAKECVKAELTMKGKIYNIKSSLHHVWHDEETKNKAQKKSATRNLHRYQSEIFIELGLTKKEKTQQ